MSAENFSLTLETQKKPAEVFKTIQNVRQWWSGIFAEKFTGNSHTLNDEFSFTAGEGIHYSKQKLIDVVPDKKIVWEITESNLSFLSKKDEWTGTKVVFDIIETKGKTHLVFTHQGLTPHVECYDSCAPAWTQYLTTKLAPLLEGTEKKLQ